MFRPILFSLAFFALLCAGAVAQIGVPAAEQQACAFKLGAAIFAKWQTLSQSGFFGCPLNAESDAPPSLQGTKGRWVQLSAGVKGSTSGGYIIAHTSGPHAGSVYEVNGCGFTLFEKMGGTGGILGFPVSDEYDVLGGRRSDFEGGNIQWVAATGICSAYPNSTVPGSAAQNPATAPPANLSGTWSITGPFSPDCTFRQTGALLIGACKGRVGEGPVTGSVNGKNATWTWQRNEYANNASLSFEFSAKLTDAGILTGTITNNGNTQPFTAAQSGAAPVTLATGAPVINDAPPRTIWDGDAGGIMRHLQSGLECPYMQGSYTRSSYSLFDKAGFDVACNYDDKVAGARITVYLTRLADPSLIQSVLDGAKKAIMQRDPKAVARDAALDFPSSLNWLKAGYSENDAALWSDIYVTALSGWFFEIRVSFKPGDSANVAKALGDVTAAAMASAGAHLAACGASPAPARAGQKLSLADQPKDAERLTALSVSGASLAKHSIVIPDASAPPVWCAESSFSVGPRNYVFWRNIAPLGKSGGPIDRITGIDGGLTVDILSDPLGAAAAAKAAPGSAKLQAATDIVIEHDDAVELVGLYDGRPGMEDAAKLTLTGATVAVYAKVSRTTNTIDIYRPY